MGISIGGGAFGGGAGGVGGGGVGGSGAIKTVVADYPVIGTDYCVLVDATAGAVIVTLPAAPATGQECAVKKIDSTANTVTIARGGTSKIDGATTLVFATQYSSYFVIYDGTDWNVL